jgi:hypothetical protein
MGKASILRALLFFAVIPVLFVSCLGNDNEEFYMIPDVVCVKKVVNDTARYALSFYVYSNYAMQSSEVNYPGTTGSPVELHPYQNTLITYAKEAGDNDFSKSAPQTGLYNFTASYGGKSYIGSDNLSANNVAVPVIAGATFNANDNSLKINWGKTTGAENYFVKMYNQDKELVYLGYRVDGDSTNYTVNITDQGWQKLPVPGNSYRLQLNAVGYEPNASDADKSYHVNSISFSEATVVWHPLP